MDRTDERLMNYETFKKHLSAKAIYLNSQQEEAMKAVEGPTLLLAVPGSGKTTTMIARIGYMIHCKGIDPNSILVLTYTNEATNDMEKKYKSIFGDEHHVEFRTINSLCSRMMKWYAKKNNLVVLKLEKENAAIIIDVYRKIYNEYPGEGEVGEAQRVVSYIKNMMLGNDDLNNIKINGNDAREFYIEYCREMERRKVIDFDDQLVNSLYILRNHPEVLESIQNRYTYILVDEAQDTSKIQHEIIRLIASKTQNIFMVGDEDQSIYGFRAAYPQALLDFERQYENARILLLEQNYRSTPQIVDVAKGFIEKNRNRKQKNMFAERPSGENIRFAGYDKRKDQYRAFVSELKGKKEKTAILYRNNESMIPLIYYLRGAGVPYSNRGADTAFFSHKVVRDVRNFFAFAENPTDPDLFMQIYYKTNLNVKKTDALETVKQFDPKKDKTLWHTYRRLYASANNSMKQNVNKVISGMDALREDDAWHAIVRVRNKIRRFDSSEEEKFNTLLFLVKWQESKREFLNKLDWLEKTIRDGSKDSRGLITLSTIHSSKGLEFNNVYIIDAIDGVLPSAEADDLEEERRLFYVAMTRAKDSLTILRYKDCKMPFVGALLPKAAAGPKKPTKKATRQSIEKKPEKKIDWNRRSKAKKSMAPPENPKAIMGFAPGDIVYHRVNGRGKIKRITQSTLTVKYDSGKVNTLDTKSTIEGGILKKT